MDGQRRTIMMSQSLSLKRCNRYGTSGTTPKRPCLTTSQSTPAASITPYSPEHCDKENETATAEDSLSTPHRSDLLTVNANSTPWNASSDVPVESSTAQSLEGLRCKRAELRQSVASKEQTLHNLNLVKLHRTKNDIEQLQSLTSKWRSVIQKAVVELHELIPEPTPSLTDFVDHLQLEHSFIGFNADDESFV